MPSCAAMAAPGDHVVARHHAYPDPGSLGIVDGLHRRLARRIDHRNDGSHLEIGHVAQQVAVRIERGGVEIAECRGHHALPSTFHAGDDIVCLLLQGRVPRHARSRGVGSRGAADHGGSRSLDETAHHVVAGRVGCRVESRHQLVRGVERQRGQSREPLPAGFDVQTRLVGQDEQSAFGGVADDRAVHELGVAGDDVGDDGIVDGGGGPGGVLDVALEAVADAGDRVTVDQVDQLDGGHLVHRERPGLVRVDRRCRSECFDGHEVLDDGVLAGKLLCAARENHLEDGRQRSGDRRDREGDRGDEQRVGGLASRQAEREHHDHRRQRRGADPQRHGVQLLRQRRLFLRGAGQHPGDLADLGVGAPRRHDHDPAAVRDRCVHERHVRLVAGSHLDVGEHIDRFRRRCALSRERRFIDVERVRLDDPSVGGHVVASGDQHHVAEDNLLDRDRRLDSAAADACGLLRQRLQARSSRFRLCPPAGGRRRH